MTASFEKLSEDMDKIVRSNPVLHLATVSVYDRLRKPHSSSVWFAPDDDLRQLFWLSSPTRIHSEHIESFWKVGKDKAPVSGSMNLPTRPSQPVLGISFEGKAWEIKDQTDKERAVGVLVARRVFFPDEAEAYLKPPEDSTMPTHSVYAAEVTEWTHFDGLKLPEDRKSVLEVK